MPGPSSAPLPAFSPVPVLHARDETPSLRALRIDLGPGLGPLHRAPGQVLRVRGAEPGQEGIFAIASRPGEDGGQADLLVKRGGATAEGILSLADRGTLAVSAPFGDGFPVGEAAGRDVLLFATGSGIAPIRALLQHLLHVRVADGRLHLFYGQRSRADFAYRGELPAWERAGVGVSLCASRPEPGWEGERGWVQAAARASGCAGIAGPGAVAYLAGLKGMVAEVRAALAEAGLPRERTFLNY